MANMKLPNQPPEEDVKNFLSKVDELDAVIKGLNSEDDETRNKYMSEADKLIEKIDESKKTNKKTSEEPGEEGLPQTRTGFSKTSINKDAYKNDAPRQATNEDQPMDQRAFMAALEADANQRAARRKERGKIADGFKEQGNAQFKQGNYKEALEFYDKAMEQVKDNTVLYTNRAQARNKLGMHKEALSDCDWALRIFPNCMKAYVHQGHAYLALKKYEEARESYREILNIDKKKENIVKDYIAEVDRSELASQEEDKASQLFEEGNEVAKGVVELLTRVHKKDQLPLYYSGGFRVIASLLTETDSQTLFRTHNGLHLVREHPVLNRCLSSTPSSLSREERDLISAALDMMVAACKGNETNQQQLLCIPDLPAQLLAILEGRMKGHGLLLRTSCLSLLHEISLSEVGRMTIVTKFAVDKLVSALFALTMKTSNYAETAAALLNNIALDRRLKVALRDGIEENVLPIFEKLLVNNKTSASIITTSATCATNLAGDAMIRNKMASRASLWTAASSLLPGYVESKLASTVEALLGLLLNISTGAPSTVVKEVGQGTIAPCYNILVSPDISELAVSRSLAIMGNILPLCPSAVEFMSEENKLEVLFNYLKDELSAENQKSALKCMTALTQSSDVARKYVAANKGTSVLLKLLMTEDENVIGNSALCLSHLTQEEKMCSRLTKTNIIQRLLVLARDSHKPSVQRNCAILIGKLTQGDPRHLERLRELHGIEILHDCMKHVK